MKNNKIILNNQNLLVLAEDRESCSNARWARFMKESKSSRIFFDKQFEESQKNRDDYENAMKLASIIVVGIGLFFTTPAVVLNSTALALSLSKFICTYITLEITLEPYHLDLPVEQDPGELDLNAAEVKKLRKDWISNANDHTFQITQRKKHEYMSGLRDILFTSIIASSAAVTGLISFSLAIGISIFAFSLLYEHQGEIRPYLEDKGKEQTPPHPPITVTAIG